MNERSMCVREEPGRVSGILQDARDHGGAGEPVGAREHQIRLLRRERAEEDVPFTGKRVNNRHYCQILRFSQSFGCHFITIS